MRVNVLLSDAAQADTNTGKIHALGLGWTRTPVPTGPMAVIVLVSFDNEVEAGLSHEITVTLTDTEGQPVSLSGISSLQAKATIDRDKDAQIKWPITAPLVMQIRPGLPLEPGQTYHWRAAIDGKTEETWFAGFITESPSPTE